MTTFRRLTVSCGTYEYIYRVVSSHLRQVGYECTPTLRGFVASQNDKGNFSGIIALIRQYIISWSIGNKKSEQDEK